MSDLYSMRTCQTRLSGKSTNLLVRLSAVDCTSGDSCRAPYERFQASETRSVIRWVVR